MKPVFVAFASTKLKKDFELLKQGKFEDKQLYRFIERAINDLKQNPSCGTKVPKRLWPREYHSTNLWKYDLPNAWRMIYTIENNEIKIVSLILEWFTHKNYEKRFKYGKL